MVEKNNSHAPFNIFLIINVFVYLLFDRVGVNKLDFEPIISEWSSFNDEIVYLVFIQVSILISMSSL